MKRRLSPNLSDVDIWESLFGLVDDGQNSQVVIVGEMIRKERISFNRSFTDV